MKVWKENNSLQWELVGFPRLSQTWCTTWRWSSVSSLSSGLLSSHHHHCHHYHHHHHRDHEQVKPGERVVFNCKVDLSCMVSTIRWWAWRLLWFLNMIILVGGFITKVFNYKGSFYHCLMLQLLIIEVFDFLHIMVSNFESWFNEQTCFDYF